MKWKTRLKPRVVNEDVIDKPKPNAAYKMIFVDFQTRFYLIKKIDLQEKMCRQEKKV